MAGYYILFVRKLDDKGQPCPLPRFPNVGDKVVHFLGKSQDADRQAKDKENPLFPKVQDGVRPAWAPDILRMGYAVVFAREGLVKLALSLGIKNPQKMLEEKGGISYMGPGGQRALTFDDVWIVGAEPRKRPMHMPPLSLTDEAWWTAMMENPPLTAPRICPGGVDVVSGAQRLADVVAEHLASMTGYPRPDIPQEEKPQEDYGSLAPPPGFRAESPAPATAPSTSYSSRPSGGQPSTLKLFRY